MDDGTLSHTYLFTFIMYDYNTKYHPFAFFKHVYESVCVCVGLYCSLFSIYNRKEMQTTKNKLKNLISNRRIFKEQIIIHNQNYIKYVQKRYGKIKKIFTFELAKYLYIFHILFSKDKMKIKCFLEKKKEEKIRKMAKMFILHITNLYSLFLGIECKFHKKVKENFLAFNNYNINKVIAPMISWYLFVILWKSLLIIPSKYNEKEK